MLQERSDDINAVNKTKEKQRPTLHVDEIQQRGEAELTEVSNERAETQQTETKSPKWNKRRGKVPILEYDTLRDHRVEMVEKIIPDKLIPRLVQNKVIDHDDVEMIEKKCKELRRKGAETMLNIVYNSGRFAFPKLIEVLQQGGHQDIAEKLTRDLKKKKNDPSSVTTTKERGSLSQLECEVLRDNHERLVNELDSSVLKNYLFKNKVIDEDDLENITKKEEILRKEGAEELVSIIHRSGANAFANLLQSLDEAGYDELSSKLMFDLQEKKRAGRNVERKIDLNSVAFPDYPVRPQLKLDTFQGDLSNWQQKIIKWKKTDGGKSWCDTMNNWFKNLEFKFQDELKMVVKDWLITLEDVVDRGCLEIDTINVLLDVTETLLYLDNNNSISNLDDVLILTNIIYGFDPNCTVKKDIEELVRTKREEKERLLKQQRQVFKILKHNLEGIIEGKQDFELPIDTERCQLTRCFHSVVDDVREIWNKLH